MAWTFDQLEIISTDELKNEYDKRYDGEIESREFILNEISRRKTDSQTRKIVNLSDTVKNLTWAIFLLTILNLILVGINVFIK